MIEVTRTLDFGAKYHHFPTVIVKDPVYDDYELYVSVIVQARMEKQRAMEAQRNKAALDRALAPPFRTEVT